MILKIQIQFQFLTQYIVSPAAPFSDDWIFRPVSKIGRQKPK